MKKTKIICTLSPRVASKEKIKELVLNGMDVARLNCSHLTSAEIIEIFETLRKVSVEFKVNVATMLDTKGPEVRLGEIARPMVLLKDGQSFVLTTREIVGDEKSASLDYKGIVADIRLGAHVFINDGLVELVVKETTETDIFCEVVRGGFISSKKGVNFPGVKLSIPFISESDKDSILLGVELGLDFVAASFTRTQADALELRNLLDEHGASTQIIAKIENREGIDNLEEILGIVDGVMVARGDMGVEIPFEELPIIQKQIINTSALVGKPSIVATQMLESMVGSPRPTRAESTDIANAVYDGASAVMLSAETAAGSYPVESLQVMNLIVSKADSDIDRLKRSNQIGAGGFSRTFATAHSAVVMAQDLNAEAILVLTKTGAMAKVMAEFRPWSKIIACAKDSRLCRQLNMLRGVHPFLVSAEKKMEQVVLEAIEHFKENKSLKDGDTVIIVNSLNASASSNNSFLKPYTIGNLLIFGVGLNNLVACGNVRVCATLEEVQKTLKPGEILVTTLNLKKLEQAAEIAAGIVTESFSGASEPQNFKENFKIPVVVGATGATETLTPGAFVQLDAGLCEVFGICKRGR